MVCSEDSHVSVERMEVLSGVLRRRNWSAEIKERIVSETLAQGVTVTEVERRPQVDRSLVYRWRRELGVTRLTTPQKSSEEHRVRQDDVFTCRSRWWRYHYNKKIN